MEDCDRLHPPGWWRQFKPPDDAKSNEEVLRPFYAALEACPSDTKLHCAIRFGRDWDSVELCGIDKNAQGQSYWEQCKDEPNDTYGFESYRPHGTGARQPMRYRPIYPSSRFSGDEWASIFNAVTKCPVLEELEIEVFRDIDFTTIEDLLGRLSAVRVLGLRFWNWGAVSDAFVAEVGKSIRKMKTLERLVLIRNYSGMDKILLEHLFPSVSSPSVAQTEDQSMLEELVWISAGDSAEHFYEVFITLMRNSRLKTIELCNQRYGYGNGVWSYQNLIGIFESLQGNKHLKKLDMKPLPNLIKPSEKDVTKEIVGKLLDLVGHDFYVEEIYFPSDLPLKFRRVETQVRKNGLKGMELINPESSRVFLCGLPYAGKTQLRTTFGKEHALLKLLKRHKDIPRTSGIEVTNIDARVAKFSFWDFGGQVDYHFLHDLFIPSSCESGGSFVILCSLVAKEGGMVIFKDGRKKIATFKGPDAIEEELVYWLRFIVSNSKISEKFKPFITLVFTHLDFAPKKEIAGIKKSVEDIVELKVKPKFGNSIQISFGPEWSFVNSRSKVSVEPLLQGLADNAQTMLKDGPRVYRLCVEVEKILMQWNEDNPQRPLIKMYKFEDLCQKSPAMTIRIKREYKVQDICKAVALALHDSGSVIYFESLNFVVVRPNWFCHDIMGRILSLDAMSATLYTGKPVANENGFVKKEVLEQILDGSYDDGSIRKKEREVEGILVDDLIQVMKEMNLCYEVAAEDRRYDGGLFIPATLRNKAEPGMDEDKMIKWQVEPSCSDPLICYLGYRLECEDEERTVLTQGFFPRVQVEFMKRFQSNANCVVKHNIISLRYDGKEVFVEYCGKSTPTHSYDHMDGYIDVLLKSSKRKAETLVFTKKHVLGLIIDVCYSANIGCPGVLLVESILNPKYVEKPSGMRDRQNQAIRVNDLIRNVKSNLMFGSELEPFNLDYDHEWPSPGGSNKAQDLLGDDEWRGLIMECSKELAVEVNKQYQDLEEVQAEVSFLREDDQLEDLTSVDANENDLVGLDPQIVFLFKTIKHLEEQVEKNHRITRGEINHRFDAFDDKLDEVLMLSKKISEQVKENIKLQKKLVLDISRNIEKVMDFSIHLQQCRVPRLLYFTAAGNVTRLITSVVPGLKSVQVHLMCEHIEGIHLVTEQKGCKLLLTSEHLQSALPYVIWGVRAISLLVKIGGVAIGAGVGSLVEGTERELIRGLARSIPLNAVPSNLDEGCVTRTLLPEDLKASIPVEKQKAAEQWLVDFLSGKSIPGLFDLHRIRYTCGSRRLAWVCGKHRREGVRDKTMEIVPA
ncbi:hypothetical protein KC19_12G149400 [Ceratodon purpureus]|uniref:C-terminal of Roc (COR) domain-containing protein n=1 Tax=Ceratodon purpureus TaxID=3225 RepID=A0A8T0GB12_CERPU|nr:hypothetical protein KC19_12G149400 [Ceratodon purpureus]